MSRWTTWLRSVLLRALVFALGWVALTEADPSTAGYGLVAVQIAVAVSLAVSGGPGRRTPSLRQAVALVRLVGWVLWRSVLGGIDVARRAIRLPHADISPYWTTYTTSIGSEAARTAFAFVSNLMPGTLTAELDGDRMDIHVIGRDLDVEGTIRALERRFTAVLDA